VLFCLTPLATPPLALLLELFVALFVGHPFLQLNHKATHFLLQMSVVGLGFGMDAATAVRAGKEGFLFTVFSIAGTLASGLLLGRWMKIERKTSLPISGGTAICGGVLLPRTGLTLTLFLIGSGLSRQVLKQTGVKPLCRVR
jgi:uncharacterized membrane protein YadS